MSGAGLVERARRRDGPLNINVNTTLLLPE